MKTPSITFLCAMLIAAYVGLLGLALSQGAWLYDLQGHPRSGDYISMWSAGHVALEGKPADAYDWGITRAAQALALGHDKTRDYPWAYPPPYIAMVALFALLPYVPSMLLFSVLTLAAFGFVNARIIGRPEGAVWMLATAVTFLNFWIGQNGALSAALLGAGLLMGPTRPIAAGVCIGLLAFKPQLGLLIPLALIAIGNWRMIFAAGGTITLMMLAALAGMGPEPFHAFLAAIAKFGGYVLSDAYPWAYKLQSPYGVLRMLGVDTSIALPVQYGFSLLAAGSVVALWRSRADYDLKCAGLAVAATFATPYMFTYDLTLLTIATAFLVRHAFATRTSPVDGTAIVAANVLIMAFPFVTFPTGPFAALAIAAAIGWRLAGMPSDRAAAAAKLREIATNAGLLPRQTA